MPDDSEILLATSTGGEWQEQPASPTLGASSYEVQDGYNVFASRDPGLYMAVRANPRLSPGLVSQGLGYSARFRDPDLEQYARQFFGPPPPSGGTIGASPPIPDPAPLPVLIPVIPPYGLPSGGLMASLATLIKYLPALLALVPQLAKWAENAKPGDQLGLENLPDWLRALILTLFGAGVLKIVYDLATSGAAAAATVGGSVPAGFTKAWKANGVQFYRSANGMLGVLNGKGRWKQWRPRKPIVIYSTGAPNIKAMLKADKALAKQAKAIEHMIVRHQAKKSGPAQKRYTLQEVAALKQLAP